MTTVQCETCGLQFESQRRTRRYCSRACANRSTWKVLRTRACRHCGTQFEMKSAADANRQHCSRQCAKNHNAKRVKAWQQEHPGMTAVYRRNQLEKQPDYERRRSDRRRQEILALLGGACAVCGVTNPHWLHVDFIPTTRGTPYRHPRHYKYVSENRHLFRVFCANHHYELTLTGRIEGTDITQ